jgi:hypothetical protein
MTRLILSTSSFNSRISLAIVSDAPREVESTHKGRLYDGKLRGETCLDSAEILPVLLTPGSHGADLVGRAGLVASHFLAVVGFGGS